MKIVTVIVEFRNAGSCVYQFEKNQEIPLDKWVNEIHKWLIENEDFNEMKDNFCIVDEVTKIKLN